MQKTPVNAEKAKRYRRTDRPTVGQTDRLTNIAGYRIACTRLIIEFFSRCIALESANQSVTTNVFECRQQFVWQKTQTRGRILAKSYPHYST